MPTGNPLGLTGGNTAASIFMDAGDSIVSSMRATGQRIQQQAIQSQTNRELRGFGQEASTLDPNSPNYIPSLLGLAGKYPMAAQSPAGRAALQTALFPAEQNALLMRDSAKFNQDLALEKLRGENRLNNGSLSGRYRRIPGVGLVDVLNPETPLVAEPEQTFNLNEGAKRVDAQGNVIAEGGPRTTANPYRFGGGVIGNSVTGEVQPLPMTPFQQGTLDQRAETEDRNQAANAITALDRDIDDAIREMAKTEDEGRLRDLQNRIDNRRSQKDTLMRIWNVAPQGPSQGAMPVAPIGQPGLPGGIPLQSDPMNSGAPTPQVGGGSVLPPLPNPPKSGSGWKKYLP